jgi:hypothetical protein
MFSIVAVVHLFKRYLLECLSLLDLFAQLSLFGVGITHVICAVFKNADVLLLSVLLCMHHWLVGFSTLLE